MNGLMKKLGLGAVLAATTLTAAVPAEAQRWGGGRWHRDRGGDAAAGAILGGIVGLGVGAAIASSNRPRYYDRGYYYDAPPPPPRNYYYDRGYYDRGYGYGYDRCWDQWRFDPYYGRDVRVRVCR